MSHDHDEEQGWFHLFHSHNNCCPALCKWKRFRSSTLMQHFVIWYIERYARHYSITWRMPGWKYNDEPNKSGH